MSVVFPVWLPFNFSNSDCLSKCLSAFLAVHMSVCLSVFLSLAVWLFLSFCYSVSLSISVYPSVCSVACLSAWPCIPLITHSMKFIPNSNSISDFLDQIPEIWFNPPLHLFERLTTNTVTLLERTLKAPLIHQHGFNINLRLYICISTNFCVASALYWMAQFLRVPKQPYSCPADNISIPLSTASFVRRMTYINNIRATTSQ